jgi:proteic killer suppression protein
MIIDFKDAASRTLWIEGKCRSFPPAIGKTARRKLAQLDFASRLDDLRSPPGNRLEALKGSRKGQYSIRINDQYRICFEFRNGNAYEVEVTDYHD